MLALNLGADLPFEIDGLVCVGMVAIIAFLATTTHRSARRCPRCREINREAAIFCAQCGTRLPER